MALNSVKKAYNYLKRNGIEDTFYASVERIADREKYTYQPISADAVAAQRKREWREQLLFSIVVPTYETKEKFLREMIDSVIMQTYPFWELIIADASRTDNVRQITENYLDKRIKYVKLKENGGISVNTNAGIVHATGDYIGLLDHDDMITSDALYEYAAKIERGKAKGLDYVMLYSDEDKCNADGSHFFEPNYKPGFNLDLLLSNNYICHFLMVKADLMKKLMLRPAFDGAQDHDLVLRVYSSTYGIASDDEIAYGHISKVLYHWRCHEDSTASNPESKRYAYEAGLAAVRDYIKEAEITAVVNHTKHNGFYRVDYRDELVYPKDGPQIRRKVELTITQRGKIAYNTLLNRYDIGAIGGPVIKNNKIVGGMMDSTKTCIYDGLNVHFSGYMHRAAMQQSGLSVDIRNMMVTESVGEAVLRIADSSEYVHLFDRNKVNDLRDKIAENKLNSPYIDVTDLLNDLSYEEYDYLSASATLCREITFEGYLNYYDPQFLPEK